MNKRIVINLLVRQTGMLLAAAAMGLSASAQIPPAPQAPAGAAAVSSVRVGDATQRLLSMQRNTAGPDRPIPGEQAGLSYQRYLDSFKHPIPERMGSSFSGTSGQKAQ